MAFGSDAFQPHNATFFAMQAALNWFVYDRVPTGAVAGLHGLGAHSDVYFLTCRTKDDSTKVTMKRLTWSHPSTRPFGTPSPLQCPVCMCLKEWGEAEWGFDKKKVVSFKLSCRGDNGKCKYQFVVNKPERLQLCFGKGHAREGSWYEEFIV